MKRLLRNPNTGILQPVDDQSSRDAKVLSYNQWAYQQAMQKRQEMLTQSDQDTSLAVAKNSNQQAYHALANALGVDATPQKDVWDEQSQKYIRPKSPPSFDQLKSKFMSLPEDQQGKIYAQGGAQFLDPETGASLLDNLRKTRDTQINKGIDSMANQITEGKVTFDPESKLYTRQIDDPNDPLGKKKLKVPISLLEAKYIKEGIDRGMLFDTNPSGGFGGKAGVAPVGPGATPPSVVPPNGLEHPSITPQPQFSTDAPTRLGEQIRSAFTPQSNLQPTISDRISDFGATVLPDLRNAGRLGANAITGGLNAIGRFTGGLTDTNPAQIPQLSYENVQSPMLAAPIQRANEQAVVAHALASTNSTPSYQIPPAAIEPPIDPRQPILNNVYDNIQSNVLPGPDQSAMLRWLGDRKLGVPLNSEDDN